MQIRTLSTPECTSVGAGRAPVGYVLSRHPLPRVFFRIFIAEVSCREAMDS
jgi:hypothetical protein